ncbi:MAG TPA: hypothetical protein VL098_05380 [Flavipsychrobacter sp.]|nr:hypothetical protein [Flavipsychrobacter sp.]
MSLPNQLFKIFHKTVSVDYPIQYREWQGRRFLVLKRDWSQFKQGETPKTDKCPFCGKHHSHGEVDGHKVARCGSPDRTCVAADGTILHSADGYYIESYNRD